MPTHPDFTDALRLRRSRAGRLGNADVPDIDIIVVPEDDPHVNDVGAKGIGEVGIVGTAAAIANAVFHATGKRVVDLLIRIEKLL